MSATVAITNRSAATVVKQDREELLVPKSELQLSRSTGTDPVSALRMMGRGQGVASSNLVPLPFSHWARRKI
jgi:hypothetical protein